MENQTEKAMQYFKDGCNCCQAVFCAYAEEMGMQFKEAHKIAEAFGGGLGGTREHLCGAVTGAVMVASLSNGDGKPGKRSQPATYSLTKEIIDQFMKKNGSAICNQLLGTDGKRLRSCSGCVEDASEILYDIINKA